MPPLCVRPRWQRVNELGADGAKHLVAALLGMTGLTSLDLVRGEMGEREGGTKGDVGGW